MAGEQKSPGFLAISPTGKVPVLVDRDFVLFESVAILNYLADKYPEKSLIPKAGTQERATYDQWMFFGVNELEANLWTMEKHTWLYPEAERLSTAIILEEKDFLASAEVLSRGLGDSSFTVAPVSRPIFA